MDIHEGSFVLDSENFEVSISDSKDNVYGNKGAGIDINRNYIVNAPFGSEMNEAEGLDHIKNLSGFRHVTNFRNGTIEGDKDVIVDGLKKGDDVVRISEFVVDEKYSVPVDCVSMFTDIFGPPDDSYESAEKGNLDKPVLSVNKTSSPKGDQVPGSVNILLEVTENGSAVDEGVNENVRDEDKNFVLGDIVWVMMKTKLWWPGFITEPSSKVPKRFTYKDCVLVKLFVNPSSVWASKSELKEFTCCFDEMVKQNSSRTFLAAVERAVNEISSHIKKELTCSCFQKPCPPKVLELKSFALSRFEPEKFLSFIKHLAIDGVVSHRVQITITRDCVSAFCRSLGHRQLQVHQLSPNRHSSRKRSRNESNETESSKNLKKHLVEKCVYGSNAGDIAMIMNSSSEGMFDDLRWAAVDGSVSEERRYSDSLRRFLSCFRRFALLRNEESEKPKEGTKDSGNNAAELDSSTVKPKKKRQRKINLNPESKDSSETKLDETKPEKKTVRKKKKVVISEVNTASKTPDLNANIFVPSVGSFPVMGQHAMSSVGGFPIIGHAMSSVGGFPIIGQHSMSSVGGFPIVGQHDMSSVGYIQIPGHAMPSVGGVQTTGHFLSSVGGFPIPGHAMSSVGGVQILGHAMSSVGDENEGNVKKTESTFINSGVGWLDSNGNSMSFVQLLNDVQGGNFAITQPEANQKQFPSFSRPLEANHINFSFQPQANPIPTPELKKKRKRKPKEKPPILVNTVKSPLPDLNGTTAESTSSQHTDKPPHTKKNKSTGDILQQQQSPPSRMLWPKNGFKPVTLLSPPGFGPPRATASPPDLVVFMKQKIEMMKSTMEKAGNSLSSEMRGKLENEIRGFTTKYSSMLGSSSSLN